MGQALPCSPAGQDYISELYLVLSAGAQLRRTDPLFLSGTFWSLLTSDNFYCKAEMDSQLGNPARTLFCLCFPADLLTGSFLWCKKHTELSSPECQQLTCAVRPLKQFQRELECQVLPLTQTQHAQ